MTNYLKVPIILSLVLTLFSVFNNCGELGTSQQSNNFENPESSLAANKNKLKLVYVNSVGTIQEQESSYIVENDHVIIDGDIILGSYEELEKNHFLHKINLPENAHLNYDVNLTKDNKDQTILALNGVSKAGTRYWPSGEVPYQVIGSDKFPANVKRAFDKAVSDINATFERNGVRVKFIERAPRQVPYYQISFNSERIGSCSSNVGVVPSQVSKMFLGPDCIFSGDIMHEMMHVLGFYHEQNRSDRNNYVEIRLENLKPEFKDKDFAFERFENSINRSDYDINSIMQYASYSFAQAGKPTIVRRDNSGLIIKKLTLSRSDIQSVRAVYGSVEGYDGPVIITDSLINNISGAANSLPGRDNNGTTTIANSLINNINGVAGNLSNESDTIELTGADIKKPYVLYNDNLFYMTDTHFCDANSFKEKYLQAAKDTFLITDVKNNLNLYNSLIANKRGLKGFVCPKNIFNPVSYLINPKGTPPGLKYNVAYVSNEDNNDALKLVTTGEAYLKGGSNLSSSLCRDTQAAGLNIVAVEHFWFNRLKASYPEEIEDCELESKISENEKGLPSDMLINHQYIQSGFSSKVLLNDGKRICAVETNKYNSIIEKPKDWMDRVFAFAGNNIQSCSSNSVSSNNNEGLLPPRIVKVENQGFDCFPASSSAMEIKWARRSDEDIKFNIYVNNKLVKSNADSLSYWADGLKRGVVTFKLDEVKNGQVIKSNYRACLTR